MNQHTMNSKILESLVRLDPRWADRQPRLTLLHGDASARRYVRIDGAGPEGSLVAMVLASEQARFSEEIMSGPPPKELPFVNLHRYLKDMGIRVPFIHRVDEDLGVLLLEDLGDTTMGSQLKDSASHEQWYGRAVDLLVSMQAATTSNRLGDCLAFARAFESDLLRWELDHFREYLLEIWKGASLTPAEGNLVGQAFDQIANTIAGWPRVFVHRDFQSRNIMVTDGQFVLIDFQDALLGPACYDLVALLRDSYVTLDFDLVERLIDRYLDGCAGCGLARPERGAFRTQFDLLTVQRKLKDAGRFVYIDRVKKNPNFLPFIPSSLSYVRQALGRLPQFEKLQSVLGRAVPELLP